MKNKRYNLIFFCGFVAIWALLAIFNIVKPYKSFSENENKVLSSFPAFELESVKKGEFTKKADNYFNEQFAFRDGWISIQSLAEYLTGKRENNGVIIAKGSLMTKVEEPNEDYVNKNIAGLNHFAEKTGKNTLFMLVPSASEIQKDRLPFLCETWDQTSFIDSVYSKVKNITPVSVTEELKEHSEEYIYYHTDHHWTTFGAYIGYCRICDALETDPAKYDVTPVSDSFNGTLYSKSGVRFFPSDTVNSFNCSDLRKLTVLEGDEKKEYDSVYFDEFLEKKDKYCYFTGENKAVVIGKNGKGTDKLLVFKDSYAHCMMPMLLENYSEVVMADLRYIKQNMENYFDVSEYDDVLFLYSTDTFTSTNDIYKLSYLVK